MATSVGSIMASLLSLCVSRAEIPYSWLPTLGCLLAVHSWLQTFGGRLWCVRAGLKYRAQAAGRHDKRALSRSLAQFLSRSLSQYLYYHTTTQHLALLERRDIGGLPLSPIQARLFDKLYCRRGGETVSTSTIIHILVLITLMTTTAMMMMMMMMMLMIRNVASCTGCLPGAIGLFTSLQDRQNLYFQMSHS